MRNVCRGLIVVALVSLTTGCFAITNALSNLSLPIPAKMKHSPLYPRPFSEVWEIVTTVAARDWKFEKVDPGKGILVSEYDIFLAPSLYSGTRRRLTIELEQKKQGVRVGLKVAKEVNENLKEPLSEEAAEWVSKGSDEDAEEILLYRIHSRLDEFKPTPELLQRLDWEEQKAAAARKKSSTPAPR